jgi:cytochrome c-type biogenesis protein
VGFVIGFSVVFILLGAFAGGIGRLLVAYATLVNVVTGSVVAAFGLAYAGAFSLPRLTFSHKVKILGFKSAVLFGAVFSVGWTPCVGAFLGSALMVASQQGSVLRGMTLLLSFSLGMGVPFILSAVLIGQCKNAFDGIKKHYRAINLISGGLLIVMGVLMMTGTFGRLLAAMGG